MEDDESLEEAAARLISKVRTIAAFSYRRSLGLPFIYPDPQPALLHNFLHMMFSLPYQQYIVTPEVEDALNLVFILHGDHEQNCSTSTVRMVGSARANLFASCAAAVVRLWGPLHGGANVEVVEMLEHIHQGGLSPEDCIRDAKDKTNPFRLYGFGHRDLQELRSAGEDPQRGLRQRARADQTQGPAAGYRAETGRTGPGRSLLRRAASSIRTSTSTAASCSGRWAFPPTCSPSVSPSGGCRAGSPSGRSSTTTRPRKSTPPANLHRPHGNQLRPHGKTLIRPAHRGRKHGEDGGIPSVGTHGRNAAGVC